MPWGWDGTGEKSVALGGRRGTVEEAAEAKAWPKYEVEYLQHRLDNPAGKYLQAGNANQDVKDHILLERAAEDYKEEADECLKAEFKDWLAGRHKDNFEQRPYENGAGKPVRRYTYRDQLVHAPKNADGTDRQIGDAMVSDAHEKGSKHDWRPTWWGDTQLTHLPGVRDYLKETEQKRSDADMYMNLLAEHGPQDLKSAWMYFKHWVKGRPVGPETCPTDILRPTDIMYTSTDGTLVVPGTYVTKPPVGQRSDFHNNMPAKLRGAEPRSERIMEAGLLQTINTAVQGGVATALATTGTPATTEQPRARDFDNTPMIDLNNVIEATAITDGLNQSLAASSDFSEVVLATPSGSTLVPLPEETATEKDYFSALSPEEQQELLKTNPDGDWFNPDGSPKVALNPGIPRARPDSPNTAVSLERELAAASLNDQRDATTPTRPVPASPLQALQVRFTRAATQAASALNPARVQIMPNVVRREISNAQRLAAETRAATAQRQSGIQPRTMARRATTNRKSESRG